MRARKPSLTGNGSTGPPPSRADASSFRDPTSTVFYADGRVLRGLTESGASDLSAVEGTGLLERLTLTRKLVPTTKLHGVLPAAPASAVEDWTVILEHERVPFVSYPFEWCFGMLKDAAILHLEVLIEALAHGVATKDGHAYNVQWWGSVPRFIDVPSFTMHAAGPWAGYRQFCETFLNPLFLQAHHGVDFQPWLRGRLAGIPVADMLRMVSVRDLVRRGVLRHVVLHGLMERQSTGPSQATARAMTEAGFDASVARVAGVSLLKLVRSMSWRPQPSAWSTYSATNTYDGAGHAEKVAFVEWAVLVDGPAKLVLDLGCNDGTYSRIAARTADYVVAVDSDHPTVERLYQSLRAAQIGNVLPLVMDLGDPTPALGWRNVERRAFFDRARPEVVLCLALVHHLAIGSNVRLPEIVAWLRSFGCPVVVEFVHRDDPMVRRMLADKPIDHSDYNTEEFERSLAGCFRIARQQPLSSGTRTLYLALPT